MARPPTQADASSEEADADEGRKAFVLRLPADLSRELRIWANQEVRSLNGQIEYLLREAVAKRERKPR